MACSRPNAAADRLTVRPEPQAPPTQSESPTGLYRQRKEQDQQQTDAVLQEPDQQGQTERDLVQDGVSTERQPDDTVQIRIEPFVPLVVSGKSDLDLIKGDGVDTSGVSATAAGAGADTALPSGSPAGASPSGAPGEVHVETRAETTLTAGAGPTGAGPSGTGPGGAGGPAAGLGTGAAAGTEGVPKLPPAPELHPERPVSSGGPAFEKPPEGSPYSDG